MEFQIRLLHLDQRGVGLYVVAGFHQNLLHRSGVIGYDGVFHLHRFEHGDLLTGLDAVADFDLDLQNTARQRCVDRIARDRLSGGGLLGLRLRFRRCWRPATGSKPISDSPLPTSW